MRLEKIGNTLGELSELAGRGIGSRACRSKRCRTMSYLFNENN